jgi:hypothetical protein
MGAVDARCGRLLEDEGLLDRVYDAQAKRCKHSRTRGRKQTPADVVLRLLILKHARNWSYDALEREVRADPLPNCWKKRLRPYFEDADLDRARIIIADPLPISAPPFVGMVRKLGFRFPDVKLVSGITFDTVIALRERPDANALFHELVHLVQYRALGVHEFARQYVRGFLGTHSYDEIPLERCAYNLEARFMMCNEVFNVGEEVRRRIDAGRF